jgi:molecular chaperone DnaK
MLRRVADEQKTPVAIRITRPYATEQEYLEREFDTLTRTSVILLGAQARPQGVVLRFEIVLKNGDSMLRGEGRVVGFKEKAYAGEPGLSLRFTRLDARSKALVDRAATMRDARVRASTSLMGMPAVVVPPAVPHPAASSEDSIPAPSSSSVDTSRRPPQSPLPPVPPPPSSRRAPPPLPEWARSQLPPPPESSATEIEIESTQVDANFNRAEPPSIRFDESPVPPPLPPSLPPPLPAAASRASSMRPPRPPTPPRAFVPPTPAPAKVAGARPAPPANRSTGTAARDLAPPPDRDALLVRLRARARSLPAARVNEILAKRAART